MTIATTHNRAPGVKRRPGILLRQATRLTATVAGLALMAGVAGHALGAEQYTLQFASYVGEQAAQMKASQWWAEEVERRTDGRVKVEFFFRGSLLGATDILSGVSQGRADLGYVANAYHPAELPLSSVVGVPFITSNAEAQMKAFHELYKRNDAFRAEWEKQGLHVLYFHPLSANILGTAEPVPGLDWIKGKRIRGLGYINQALQMMGANAVAIPAPEIYEALQRGTIDGYSGFAFEVVTALKLHEVAPYITAMGMGNYVFAATPITKSTWDDMPQDLRGILSDVSDEYTDKVVDILAETEDEVCRTIKDSGGAVQVLPREDVERIRGMIGDRIVNAWIDDTNDRGVDAEAFFADYQRTLRKYERQSDYVPGVRRCAASM